jgi:hypothetical protein
MDIATPNPAPARRYTWLWIALAGAVGIFAVGTAVYLVFGRGSSPSLAAAEKSCNDGRTDTTLGDGGKTLIINASGDAIKSIIDVQTVACVLDYLHTPAAVRSHISSTRALDGRQTDSWDGFTAAWTYHPDDGLDITIEAK